MVLQDDFFCSLCPEHGVNFGGVESTFVLCSYFLFFLIFSQQLLLMFLWESRGAQDQPSHTNKNDIILQKNKAWASWAFQVKQVIPANNWDELSHLIPLTPIVTNINLLQQYPYIVKR